MSKFRVLTPEEERVIIGKGTEMPYTGKYESHFENGAYLCRQCGTPLYLSSSKFHSECGWPSFDDAIPGAVKQTVDADGRRIEITCNHCGGHLGHVFKGEGFTPKDTRYCVNSVSLDFVKTDTAYFASGCFWGTEYYFEKAEGIITTDVGYMGGHVDHPTYKQVCTGETGHLETTQVIFNPEKTSFESLVKLFFETHDFSQTDGQGPDIGSQYHSAIFAVNEEQKEIANRYKKILAEKGYFVATEVKGEAPFWRAEDYHQNYYTHKNGTPYCHVYRKIF
ncbi:MAG: bifunctional methionine sulfoxide reductase B/A protein [Bacteroidales bacterium]|nr:bifunctional methionine sulfoxide reductase B/A protein [Bacteroidales bacterium]